MFNLFGILKGLLVQSETDRTKQLVIQVSPSATTGTTLTINAVQTANRTISLPDADGTVMTPSSTDTLSNKTISGSNNTLLNLPGAQIVAGTIPPTAFGSVTDAVTLDQSGAGSTLEIKAGGVSNTQVNAAAAIALTKLAAVTASHALQSDASGVIQASGVTNTTLAFLDATSSVQTQLNSKASASGLTTNHVVTASGAAALQTTPVIVDSSGNMSGVHSFVTDTGNLTFPATGGISGTNSSALYLTTNLTSQPVFTDRTFLIIGSGPGVIGSLQIRGDTALGGANVITLNTPANITANRTQVFPNASGNIVVDSATQTLSAKTFSDPITLQQNATPANPSAGFDKLYVKSDDQLYSLTSAGVERRISNANLNVVSKTANYTITNSDDVILCDISGGGFNLTLPTVVGNTGKKFIIKLTNSNASGQQLNINTFSGTQFIESGSGNITTFLIGRRDEVSLISDGVNAWNIDTKYFEQYVDGSSNGTFIGTQPSASNVWANVVGNNFGISPGTWELSASLFYTNNGTSAGYSNHYGYWCAATGTNTTTNPAALSTITGLTVIGGYTPAYIADTLASDSMVILPNLIVTSTVFCTIFVGMRATCTTAANARYIPVINAKRIK